MAIYFLRHGESEANLEGVFAGQKNDTPLSELGISQAYEAATELKSLHIDRIIASRLSRTKQTAEVVAEVIGFDPTNIEYDDSLLEYDMGSITGTPIRKVTSKELTSAQNAEDPKLFCDRVISFLREYKDSDETILIVTHAGVGRAIESTRLGLDPVDFYGIKEYPNAHAVKLDLDWL